VREGREAANGSRSREKGLYEVLENAKYTVFGFKNLFNRFDRNTQLLMMKSFSQFFSCFFFVLISVSGARENLSAQVSRHPHRNGRKDYNQALATMFTHTCGGKNNQKLSEREIFDRAKSSKRSKNTDLSFVPLATFVPKFFASWIITSCGFRGAHIPVCSRAGQTLTCCSHRNPPPLHAAGKIQLKRH
jgi:hypothetical protein